MKTIKEKTASKQVLKPHTDPVVSPKQAARLLKDKYVKELEQRPESESVDASWNTRYRMLHKRLLCRNRSKTRKWPSIRSTESLCKKYQRCWR